LWFYAIGTQTGDVASTEYYTPAGQLYAAASGAWDPVAEGGSICFTDSSLKIAGNQPANLRGAWMVKIKIDGQVLAAVAFTVSADGGSGTRPAIRAGGVASASGFGGMYPITAGTWIEIFGSNLAATSRSWTDRDFDGAKAPTSLDGVTVQVNSKAAFIGYVSPTQLNVLAPSDIGTGTMQIVVANANGASDSFAVTANALQPGLLAPPGLQANGWQYAAAALPDGRYALPAGLIPGVASRAAKPGEVLTIYGIGFGPVIPGMPAGTVAGSASSLAAEVQMVLGGAPVSLLYAGMGPGMVGLYQFNLVVPNVADSDAVPLTFSQAGNSGPKTIYVAVHK
jgi:uncharacterized protein (TIGR03437 family)